MKNIIKEISNNLKIRNKLILTYLIVAIATVSIIGIYSANKMQKIVINKDIEQTKSSLDIMENTLQESLKIATKVSDMIYSDYELSNILTRKYDNYGDVVKDYSGYSNLKNYLRYYKELYDIKIYEENYTLLENEYIIRAAEDVKKEEWYKNAVNDNGKISWRFVKDPLSGANYLSLVRELKDQKGKMTGVLVINMNPSILTNVTNFDNKQGLIELNEKIISTQDSYEFDKKNLKVIEENKSISSGKSLLRGKTNGIDSYILINSFNTEKASNDKFKVYIIIPLTEITNETNKVVLNTLKISLASIALSMIIILYFSKNISNRINLFRGEMHKVVTGDFNTEDNIEGNDEIGQLGEDLNIMKTSIKNLINEVYVGKIRHEKLKRCQKDIEFKMLSSQINPHFLYNTLETIRMKAICKDQKELADLVKKLGKLMRRNLEVSGREVSLKSELVLIENYLDIQAVRFEGKVNYSLQIENNIDVENYKIQPLLLQPIIENAFIHGLENKKNKGSITVKIYENKNKLNIDIIDDGIGIESEKLIKFKKRIRDMDDANKHIGMANVNERIKLYYGDSYGIEIESTVGIGTKVTLYLPI